MTRKSLTTVIATAVVGMTVLAGSNRAQAQSEALLVEATSGSNTVYFYSTDTSSFQTNFTVGEYSGTLDQQSTNYAGTPNIGRMSTAVTLETVNVPNGQTAPNLTVQVYVINAITGLSTGQVTYNQVSSATLASWSLPTQNPLTVNASTTVNGQSGVSPTGSAYTTTYYNSPTTTSPSSSTAVVASNSVTFTTSTTGSGTSSVVLGNSGGYNLGQELVISGVNNQVGGFSITGNSSVTGPEPSTMALAAIGALGFAGYGIRRRRARTV